MPPVASVETVLGVIKTDVSKILGMTVGSHKVTPGLEIPKAEAQSTPEISLASANGTYIVISLDIDAPFPSYPFLSPVLHWMQSGLRSSNNSDVLTSTEPVIARYAGPGPPPISSSHRYVFLLYEQPADFDVQKFAVGNPGIGKRMKYNLGSFEKEAKLGPIVAANYFNSN